MSRISFLLLSLLSIALIHLSSSSTPTTPITIKCPPPPNEFPLADPNITKKQGTGAVRLTFERVYIPEGTAFYVKASPLKKRLMENRAIDSGTMAKIAWNDTAQSEGENSAPLSSMIYPGNVWTTKKFFYNRDYTVQFAEKKCEFIHFYMDIEMSEFAKRARKEPMQEGGVLMLLDLWFGWIKGKDADRNWVIQERRIEVEVTVGMRPPPEIRQEL